MIRDDDYLREVLLEWEAEGEWLIAVPNHLGGSEEDRKYLGHVMLAVDAGLVAPVGKDTYRLTAQGHDYLDALRDEGIWSRTKQTVAETGGNATLSILQQIGLALLRKKISDHTGLDL